MAYPYELHKWSASTVFSVGDVVRANPLSNNTLAFKCITAGTSGSTDLYEDFEYKEPAFPRKIAQELDDNEVKWVAFEPLAEELLRLAPTAVIDLFEVYLTKEVNGGQTTTLRYNAGTNGIKESIKFGGHTYPAVPVEIDGFEFSGQGTLPRPKFKVANANNAITSLMVTYNPLGAKVVRIRTFAKFLDTGNFNGAVPFATDQDVENVLVTQNNDSLIMESFNDTADENAKIEETWYIDRVSAENLQYVEFELTPKIDLTNVALPKRTIEEFCPWEYRGPVCGYDNDACFTVNDVAIPDADKVIVDGKVTNDICGKKLSSCKRRFGGEVILPYGGFYGARLQA